MECKLVQDYLDGKITTIDKDVIQLHLETCSNCAAYQAQITSVEEDLTALFQSSNSRPDLNKKIIRKLMIKRRNTILALAASLLILFATFNTEIMTFAEKLPFIQDIMAYFERDNRVEFALEKGYPVDEYIFSTGEYKLIVKDIYIDALEFRMQFTLLDKDGNVPNDMSLSIHAPEIQRYRFEYPTNPNKPWWSYTCELEKPLGNKDFINIDFDIKKDDETISSESINLDISHVKKYDFEDIVVDNIIELETGKFEIISFNIGPTSTTLKYQPIEQYNSVEHRLNLILVDDSNKEYMYSEMTSSGDSPIITVRFNYSSLEEHADNLKLKIIGYQYKLVTSIGHIQNDKLKFTYLDQDFVLKKRLANNFGKRGRVYANDLIDARLFPELAFKENENWTAAIMANQDEEFVPIGKSLVIEALGEDYDVNDPETFETLVKYIKENEGIELDLEYLKECVYFFKNDPQLYLKTTKEFYYEYDDFQFKTDADFEGLEFGIIGDSIHKTCDIEIDIKPNQ